MLVAVICIAVFPFAVGATSTTAFAVSIAGICLALWISETVPPFVPTLLLFALIPLTLGRTDPAFALSKVLSWAADPVIALFLGGFTLGLAAHTAGLDDKLRTRLLKHFSTSIRGLLLAAMLASAFFSMWLSNIAAAALVFACIGPILGELDHSSLSRRSLLVAVAFGANIGGMATPVGTGPNAIAIAAVSQIYPISFLDWMAFALPLTVAMLLLGYSLIVWKVRNESISLSNVPRVEDEPEPHRAAFVRYTFFAILTLTVLFWVTEPVHGIPSAVVALVSAAAVFATGILGPKDLGSLDWSTLILIAGGITLGRLFEAAKVVQLITDHLSLSAIDPTIVLLFLCLLTAAFSALMSNTATVVLMIPLAVSLFAQPSTAILIAISASFGMPLIISTPPNAMAFGNGGLRFGDLFWPGILLIIVGCVIVSISGRQVLNFAGIP